MSRTPEEPFLSWTKAVRTTRQIYAVVEADLLKLFHDPTEVIARLFQPAVWLLIFGQAMAKVNALPTHGLPYLDYIAPGIMAQSILFIAIFYGIILIWERDMGSLHKILVTPAPRSVFVIGRALAAGIRSIPQALVVFILSILLGIDLNFNIFALLGVVAIVILIAAIFSTFSLIVASLLKKRERFMGIGQLMTMPLFFASNALYPIESMPHWIKVISILNPLTYLVDALRSLMIVGAPTLFGLPVDFAVGIAVFSLLAIYATRVYPKILY